MRLNGAPDAGACVLYKIGMVSREAALADSGTLDRHASFGLDELFRERERDRTRKFERLKIKAQ